MFQEQMPRLQPADNLHNKFTGSLENESLQAKFEEAKEAY